MRVGNNSTGSCLALTLSHAHTFTHKPTNVPIYLRTYTNTGASPNSLSLSLCPLYRCGYIPPFLVVTERTAILWGGCFGNAVIDALHHNATVGTIELNAARAFVTHLYLHTHLLQLRRRRFYTYHHHRLRNRRRKQGKKRTSFQGKKSQRRNVRGKSGFIKSPTLTPTATLRSGRLQDGRENPGETV